MDSSRSGGAATRPLDFAPLQTAPLRSVATELCPTIETEDGTATILVEVLADTRDWYTEDDDGNLIGTDDGGSWEAEVDDAEDMAVIVRMGVTVELSDGTEFGDCLKTLEWTPLDPGVLEFKYYAGVVGVESLTDDERVELSLP